MNLTRRSFVGSMGAGVAALGATLAECTPVAEAQLLYMPKDWHAAEFDKLVKSTARVKQLFDCEALKGGEILGPIKNSINGLHFGFGIAADQIKMVGAFRGQANMLNFDDSMWEKYKLGESAKIDDPKTSKPTIRNLSYPKKEGGSPDPQDRESIFQDASLEALMGRGLTLLSCHNATESLARGIVKRLALTVGVEEVVKDLQAHMLPGVISVPAMVAAIAILQVDGHYAYTVG
jgi:hypothetical protein